MCVCKVGVCELSPGCKCIAVPSKRRGGSAWPSLTDMEDVEQGGEEEEKEKEKMSYRSWSGEPEGT